MSRESEGELKFTRKEIQTLKRLGFEMTSDSNWFGILKKESIVLFMTKIPSRYMCHIHDMNDELEFCDTGDSILELVKKMLRRYELAYEKVEKAHEEVKQILEKIEGK